MYHHFFFLLTVFYVYFSYWVTIVPFFGDLLKIMRLIGWWVLVLKLYLPTEWKNGKERIANVFQLFFRLLFYRNTVSWGPTTSSTFVDVVVTYASHAIYINTKKKKNAMAIDDHVLRAPPTGQTLATRPHALYNIVAVTWRSAKNV